jgi:hypothetical protein
MTFKTSLVENTWLSKSRLGYDFGWGNGYISIPENHPFHGIDYNILNDYINVHGGLTYSNMCKESNYQKFNLSKEDVGNWIIGFDTAHTGDSVGEWHIGAVQAETDLLLLQVIWASKLSKEEILSRAKDQGF